MYKPKDKPPLYLSDEIIRRIQVHLGDDERMPLGAAALSPSEIKAIEEYIKGLDAGRESSREALPSAHE